LGDCLRGRMIFELLIVMKVKNTVLQNLMSIAWSVYPDVSDEPAASVAPEFSVVSMEVKTLPESSFHVNAFHVNAFHRTVCLRSL
jgi:hypothetical protein